MKFRKTNWKHSALGTPVLFAILYLILYLSRCLFN